MTKTVKKQKHVPQRTCVGCREINPKRSLTRIVRTETGLAVDPSGKMSGRGAYLHNNYSCWQNGLKGKLAGALKIELKDSDQEILLDFMKKLPDAINKDEKDR